MARPIACTTCGETRRKVTLWRQIMAIADVVCCWSDATERPAGVR